jgi:uncharacterized membrane protein
MVEYPAEDEPVAVRRRGGALDALHALLGAFPAAYFLLAFLMDIAYVQTAYWMWEYFAIWLITAGLVAGALAVLVGIIDWLVRRTSARGSGWSWHALITILALLLGLLNAFIHSRDGWTAVVPEGIVLSGVTSLLLIVAAFLGAAWSRRAVS